MPSSRFQKGDVVMGRWPGSNLYYEVKVLTYDPDSQLYTVIYKDGTELDLKETDIKSNVSFRQTSGRSRSRSPSRRRSRSRSPARTTRRSSARVSSSPRRRDPRRASWSSVGGSVGNITKKTRPGHRFVTASPNRTYYGFVTRKVWICKVLIHSENIRNLESILIKGPSVAGGVWRSSELPAAFPPGTFLMMLFLPSVVMALLLKTALDDARLLTVPDGVPAPADLLDWRPFGLVLLWLLFQALLYVLPVGKVAEGMPLKSGKRLKYRINGFYALLASVAAVGVALHQEVDLSYVHAHFLQFFASAALLSALLSVWLYVRARALPGEDLAPSGNSGFLLHDFFMGRELNPRVGAFDVKFFCEMRPGLIGWLVINFSMLLAEMKVQKLDSPSPAMLLVNIFQFLWVADGLWHEEKILTTMDIVHDGFGFMLAFGDLVWVPFTFSCQAYYLVSHPNDLSVFWMVAIISVKAVGYYVFRKANSEKNNFRRNPADPALSYLKTIPTATGKSLIVSGLWGVVRHPNYLGDLLMGVAWSLPCGFNHVLPYFYLIYLLLLLIHRDARDNHQCRKKYGSAWDEYCRVVPYRIFPKVY
uniref:Delta(14)-sterol reductase LBR n=1 Tax=Denticeps clupeoides TaxID=299321 RepID=A0AAY4B1Z7_9TELE